MDKTKFKFQFRGVALSEEAKSAGSKNPDKLIITEMTGPGNNFYFILNFNSKKSSSVEIIFQEIF